MAKIAFRSRSLPQLDLEAIEIEGARLQHDVVMRIAEFDMPDQSEDSYNIQRGLKLRDEVKHYFGIAHTNWKEFEQARENDSEDSTSYIQKLLTDCLGFEEIKEVKPFEIGERKFPIGHCVQNGRVPIVIAPPPLEGSRKAGVDELLPEFGDNNRRSASQLLQAYLNTNQNVLWGIVTDGLVLRLLRDSVSLTRPSWVEINLEKIFSENLFSEFLLFWLLLHASRFGAPEAKPSDCSLEWWYEEGRITGSTVREKLRFGVEKALEEIGTGFLENAANDSLRLAIRGNEINRQRYFEELLRLVYRLIFLFTAEDRNLLHVPGTSDSTMRTYRSGYSVGRLRDRCVRNRALDRHCDTWEGLCVLFSALATSESNLGLPALGGLFDASKLSNLEGARISNRRLLKAIWHLTYFRSDNQLLTLVNWRDMETEELGSVYESLLELVPLINLDARIFSFQTDGSSRKGNERKTSGGYYTPDSLVQLLLNEALDPVLDSIESCSPSDPVAEFLKLSVIDPASGSGHFLLGAARRIADRIVQFRSPESHSQEIYQHAFREVVSNCIYGVDRNPMAVELCKVALWIEALEPGKPLTFLDGRILCGDSLLGIFDPNFQTLLDGLPDEAFDPLTGDDKTTAQTIKKINKSWREDKAATGGIIEKYLAPESIRNEAVIVDAMPENNIKEIRAKSRAWKKLEENSNHIMLRQACDTYVAAFLLPKVGEVPESNEVDALGIPTTNTIWSLLRSKECPEQLLDRCTDVARKNFAFHWPLAFPSVMARGGFDVVIGNPPWERIKLQEVEFFSTRHSEIAAASNKAERSRLIRTLKSAEMGTFEAHLFEEFQIAKRVAEATSTFVRKTGRFPLTGIGDINTYALFAELFFRLTCKSRRVIQNDHQDQLDAPTEAVTNFIEGRAGAIVPTGIAVDATTSKFFSHLVNNEMLATVYDFENREGLFVDVHRSSRFSVFVIGKEFNTQFAVFLLNPHDLEETERQVELKREEFRIFNPNTHTLPLFRARADRDLTRKVYQRMPILIRERPSNPDGNDNPWGLSFQRMYDMSNDSNHFRTAEQLTKKGYFREGADWRHEDGQVYVPLYEAKMIHHFDHRFGSFAGLNKRPRDSNLPRVSDENKAIPDYEIEPWYWVPKDETLLRISRVPQRLKQNYRKRNETGCLKVLTEWVAGTLDPDDLHLNRIAQSVFRVERTLKEVLGERALSRDIVGAKLVNWLKKNVSGIRKIQRETPLSSDDILFIKSGPENVLELTAELIERKQVRWMMGWRKLTNATNERTVISSVFPNLGTGDSVVLKFTLQPAKLAAVLNACMGSLIFDYICRQKLGGTNLQYNIVKQLAVPTPNMITHPDIAFVAPRVLELTYTSRSLTPWAEDLNYFGPPYKFDPARRATLRADIDAFFAIKYGLNREELLYVLDPSETHGQDYPSETFRGLKRNETDKYGEFRTRRLVLEAYDRQCEMHVGSSPHTIWNPVQENIANVGSLDAYTTAPNPIVETRKILTAILNISKNPIAVNEAKLLAAIVVESKLLVHYSPNIESPSKERIVGREILPEPDNVFDQRLLKDLAESWDFTVASLIADAQAVEDVENSSLVACEELKKVKIDAKLMNKVNQASRLLSTWKYENAIASLPNSLRQWIVGNVGA